MLWQSQKGASDYDVTEADVIEERTETGMTRLFLQIGRQDGIRPTGDIVGAIANEAGVPGSAIGAIDIMDRSTFVEVPEADAARVMDVLGRTKLRGKRVYVDIARPRREDNEFDGPPRRPFDRDNNDNRSGRDNNDNRGNDNRGNERFGGRDERFTRSAFRPHRPDNRPEDAGRRFRRNG